MGYWHDIYIIRNKIEHEYKFVGHYGKKGEKKAPRKKPTPEQMELYNRINKAKKIRRTTDLNFEPRDYWVMLPDKKGKTMPEAKQDFKELADKLRYEYKKRGYVLKWMRVIEIGKKGGLHIHLIVNRIADTDILISENWKHGHPYFKHLYEEGDYEQLASYMAKLPEEEDGKEPEKSREERMAKLTKENYSYSTSRNLVRPEPAEHHRYLRRTLERAIRDGPKPTPGYEVDKSSIRTGVNKFTGMSYLYYTERLIKEKRRE